MRTAVTWVMAAGFALLLADALGWWPHLWGIVTGIDHEMLPAHMRLAPWGWTLGITISSLIIRTALGRKRPAKTF
jgi:hypothetical protein